MLKDLNNSRIPVLFETLKKRKITQRQLAEAVGVSTGNVTDWKSGKGRPNPEKLVEIADYLNCSVHYLLGKTDDPTPIKSNITTVIGSENIYQIPVFESVSAGFGAYASNDIIDFMPIVIKNPHDASDTIAIKVSGDSMYPKIEDGDIAVVRRQTSVDKGDIAVLLLDGEEGLVKRVIYDTDWIELQSINPEYKPKRFEGAEVQRLQVVGKVIQIIKIL